MHKHYLAFILITSLVCAQAPEMQWIKTLGGSNLEQARSIWPTPDGGYVALGETSSNNGDIADPPGYIDLWLVKLDANGQITWNTTLGSNNTDSAAAIALSDDGGYVISGTVGSCNRDIICTDGISGIWAAKVNATGQLVWQHTYGGLSAQDIKKTADGGYIIAGTTNITGHFYDALVIKINTDGNVLWQQTIGGTGEEQPLKIIQTDTGDFVAVGYSNQNFYDAWVFKLNASGALLWQKNFGGSSQESANSIAQANDGNYVIAGRTSSSDGDISHFYGNVDAWIFKITPQGNLIWEKTYGGSGDETAYDLTELANGGYLIAGNTVSNNDGDIIGGHPNHDAWLFRIGPNGNLWWQQYVGSNSIDQFLAVQTTPDNGIIAAGYTQADQIMELPTHGGGDFLIAKFAAENLNTDVFDNQSILAFPNPVTSVLTLSGISKTEVRLVRVYNDLGQLMLLKSGPTNSIDLAELVSGVYLMQLDYGNTIQVIKFLKK